MAENSSSDQEKDDPSFTELLNLLKDEPDFEKDMRGLIEEVVTQREAASERAHNRAMEADKTGVNTGEKNVLSPVRGTDGSVKPQEHGYGKTRLTLEQYKKMAKIMVRFPKEAFEKRNGFVKELYARANIKWESYGKNWKKEIEDYLDNHRNGDETAVLTNQKENLEITELRELKESVDSKFEALDSRIDVLQEMLTELMKNDVKEGIENRDKETDQKPEIKKEPSS